MSGLYKSIKSIKEMIMESDIGEVCATYNKAIEFALELNTYHVKLFLELWHNGDYEEIEQLFPEFDTTCAEDCAYVGNG